MDLNNFYYAYNLLNTLYDILIDEEEFEEIGLLAWNLIGNKRCKLYRDTICLEPCSNEFELPCNCDILEAVTAPFEDFLQVSNRYDGHLPESFAIELYIEGGKSFEHPLYISGKYIPYELVGNMVYLTQHFDKVNILYKGVVLDELGLPEITEKEAMAIATYIAYIIKFKEGLRTPLKGAMDIANYFKSEWLKMCDRARVPDYISQNDWDEVLDAKNNYNRKIFNKSYKPLK